MKLADVDSAMAKAAAGREARALQETLDPLLVEENARIDRRAFEAIRDREMTPDLAVHLWHEKNAIYRLVANLMKKQRVGSRAGTAMQADLENT